MKLYRGLKSSEFKHFSEQVEKELTKTWEKVLSKRAKGDRSYPKDLDQDILKAEKLLRLQRQHFTDRQEIALAYAKEHKGALVEIDVPTKTIIKYFQIEFQNFSKRKTSFEVVYVVDSKLLNKNKKLWNLKIKTF